MTQSKSPQTVTRNYAIDLLKLLLAFLVIVRHSPAIYKEELLPLSTCAVPVFFMVSGYFLLTPSLTEERLKRAIWRILQIVLFASILYYVFFYVKHGQPYIPSLKDVALLLVSNEIPFAGHLWYLTAYIYVLIVVLILLHFKKLHWLKVIVPVVLLLYIIGDVGYLNYTQKQYMTITILSRNWLFTGLPFFCLGAWIREKNKQVSPLWWLMFLALAFVEYDLLSLTNHIGDVFLMTLPLTIAFFAWFITKRQDKDNCLSLWGRKYSLYIYVFHPLVITLCVKFIKDEFLLDWMLPLIVCVLSLLLSMLYVKCKDLVHQLVKKPTN